MGALSQLRSPCRILGQYGSLMGNWEWGIGNGEENCSIILRLPCLPCPPHLTTPMKNGKSVAKLLRNAFSKRVLFSPALDYCWRDFCPYSVKTSETWSHTIPIQVIPDEMLLENFINLYFLVGFGSGVAGYFEH